MADQARGASRCSERSKHRFRRSVAVHNHRLRRRRRRGMRHAGQCRKRGVHGSLTGAAGKVYGVFAARHGRGVGRGSLRGAHRGARSDKDAQHGWTEVGAVLQ